MTPRTSSGVAGGGPSALKGVTAVDAQLPFLNHVAELLHNQGRNSFFDASIHGQQVRQHTATHSTTTNTNNLATRGIHSAHSRTSISAPANTKVNREQETKHTDDGQCSLDVSSSLSSFGGVELALLLEEFRHLCEQIRSALRKIFDVVASSHAHLNLQEAANEQILKQ